MSDEGKQGAGAPQRGLPPYEVVLIGASTGGPRAIAEVLSHLPATLGAGVVIAQHMPAAFTRTFADRLDRSCALPVREAVDGDAILPGSVLVAPGGRQTSVERTLDGLVVRVSSGSGAYPFRPSIDHLFTTAAAAHARAIAVVLTGMGTDGSRGIEPLRRTGALTIVESRETAVIYGMPRAVASLADHTLRLEKIGPALAALCPVAAPPELPTAGPAR